MDGGFRNKKSAKRKESKSVKISGCPVSSPNLQKTQKAPDGKKSINGILRQKIKGTNWKIEKKGLASVSSLCSEKVKYRRSIIDAPSVRERKRKKGGKGKGLNTTVI